MSPESLHGPGSGTARTRSKCETWEPFSSLSFGWTILVCGLAVGETLQSISEACKQVFGVGLGGGCGVVVAVVVGVAVMVAVAVLVGVRVGVEGDTTVGVEVAVLATAVGDGEPPELWGLPAQPASPGSAATS